jgi:hypothetical protein
MKPQQNKSPTKIQVKSPKPGSAQWKNFRDWLLAHGDIRATGSRRSIRINVPFDARTDDRLRSLAGHFKVPLAVFVRAGVSSYLDAAAISS